ncbi:hypothetical protein BDR04DRAFT_1119391 [Suillus decipiens]|nr:hypothetical protein BDR04DRAFT_1119391 [Suillus decipiens]
MIIPPVGEEGFSVSHGGGELELYEDLSNALSSQCPCIDDCDQHDHTTQLALSWAAQYESLVDVYLQFHYESPSFVSLPTTILLQLYFESDLAEKHSYLEAASQHKYGDSIQVEYVKALNDLDLAQTQWEAAQHEFNRLDLRILDNGFTNKDIANVCHNHTTAQNQMEMKAPVVEDFEACIGVEEQWSPTHTEHIRVQSHIANVQYHKAVDDVERLVVMQLLELMKLQMSGLGYKL